MNKVKLPVTAEIYNSIKEQIVTLQLMPGQLLMVQQLSKDSGISRTPVREALVRLQEDGLVTEATGNKFRVSEITWKYIDALYTARIAVETLSASYAAQNATASQLKKLDKIHTEMKKCVDNSDFKGYFAADMQLHSMLLQILDNPLITDWMEKLTNQEQRIRYLTLGVDSHMALSMKEHERILSAIADKDAARAKEAMESHLERSRHAMLSLRGQAGPGFLIKD